MRTWPWLPLLPTKDGPSGAMGTASEGVPLLPTVFLHPNDKPVMFMLAHPDPLLRLP